MSVFKCDICDKKFGGYGEKPMIIGGYKEVICEECYNRGMIWAIKEAYNWRSQVEVDRKK